MSCGNVLGDMNCSVLLFVIVIILLLCDDGRPC